MFNPELQHEVNGKTAIEMMCNGFKSSASQENPESRFDFSTYFIAQQTLDDNKHHVKARIE